MRPDGELFDPAEAAVLRAHAGQDLALKPVPMTPQVDGPPGSSSD